nr:hypothetical protein Iba_chr13eCG10590 [Ipomoea batatas]
MVRGGGDVANLRSSGLWFAVAFGGAGVGRNRRQRKDAWTGLCGWKEPRCVADLLHPASHPPPAHSSGRKLRGRAKASTSFPFGGSRRRSVKQGSGVFPLPRFVRKYQPADSPVLMKSGGSDQRRNGGLPLPFPFPRAESSEEGDERCWAAAGAEPCGRASDGEPRSTVAIAALRQQRRTLRWRQPNSSSAFIYSAFGNQSVRWRLTEAPLPFGVTDVLLPSPTSGEAVADLRRRRKLPGASFSPFVVAVDGVNERSIRMFRAGVHRTRS